MKKDIFNTYLFKSFLVMEGLKGRFIVSLNSKVFNCFIVFRNNELFIVDFAKKILEEKLSSLIKTNLKGTTFSFSKRLNLVGIGFRCWTIFEENKKFLIVKTSLSKDCILFVPSNIDIFCLNSTTIFVTGVTKLDVNSFVLLIKRIKKPNFYKKKGIFLGNEIVKVKVGKKM